MEQQNLRMTELFPVISNAELENLDQCYWFVKALTATNQGLNPEHLRVLALAGNALRLVAQAQQAEIAAAQQPVRQEAARTAPAAPGPGKEKPGTAL